MTICIIFDCDGVLVDSETIAHQVGINSLEKLGYNLTIEESIRKFTGKNHVGSRQIVIEDQASIFLKISFSQGKFSEEVLRRFQLELKPLFESRLNML